MSELLKRLDLHAFRPLPFLRKGHAQTLASFYFPHNPFISNGLQHTIPLPDHDQLVVIENLPEHPRSSGRILLLIHGLTGSHASKYLVRFTRRFVKQGYIVIRMNMRGCGAGIGLAKYPYHSGRSEDARAVLAWIAKHYPGQPVTQIGISVGANLTLKMAGEMRDHSISNCDSIVAISPPLDLKASVKLITHKKNKVFDHYFVKGLIKHVREVHRFYPQLVLPEFPASLNLYEFDDIYTAPFSGFKNAEDFYHKCSSKHFVNNISIPTFLLHSRDDPFIARRPIYHLPNKENFDVLITQKGGHVGWLGLGSNWRWMDEAVNRWVNAFDLR